MPKKLTTEQFIEKAVSKHGNKYDYSLVDYKDNKTKVNIICKDNNHGVFKQTPNGHLNGHGCPRCASINTSNTHRKTTKQFIIQAKMIHQNIYNYDNVIYIKAFSKVEITCRRHGAFKQTPANHLKGHGCPRCVGIGKSNKDLIKDFKQVHKDRYDYKLVDYKDYKTKIKIICKKHGIFNQRSISHLKGVGCPKCAGFNKDTIDVIKEFKVIHKNKYNYSLVNFKDTYTKIEIICKKHGVFRQLYNNHLNGHGCPKCNHSVSKPEQKIAKFIEQSVKIKTNKRFYYNNNKNFYELDIFIPSLNIGIEYNGLEFHHTHGDNYKGKNKFHKDKFYHRDKSDFFRKNHNIRVIHLWEHEWIKKQDIVKSFLNSQLNIFDNTINSKDTIIKEINDYQAKEFMINNSLDVFNKQDVSFGLFYNKDLVSIMGFNKLLDWRIVNISNKLNTNIKDGREKLLTFFLDKYHKPKLEVLSNNRLYSMNIYKKLGFTHHGRTKPIFFIHKGLTTYLNVIGIIEELNNSNYFQVFNTGMSYWSIE